MLFSLAYILLLGPLLCRAWLYVTDNNSNATVAYTSVDYEGDPAPSYTMTGIVLPIGIKSGCRLVAPGDTWSPETLDYTLANGTLASSVQSTFLLFDRDQAQAGGCQGYIEVMQQMQRLITAIESRAYPTVTLLLFGALLADNLYFGGSRDEYYESFAKDKPHQRPRPKDRYQVFVRYIGWLAGFCTYSWVLLSWANIIRKTQKPRFWQAFYYIIYVGMAMMVFTSIINCINAVLLDDITSAILGIINTVILPSILVLQAILMLVYGTRFLRYIQRLVGYDGLRKTFRKLTYLSYCTFAGYIVMAICTVLTTTLFSGYLWVSPVRIYIYNIAVAAMAGVTLWILRVHEEQPLAANPQTMPSASTHSQTETVMDEVIPAGPGATAGLKVPQLDTDSCSASMCEASLGSAATCVLPTKADLYNYRLRQDSLAQNAHQSSPAFLHYDDVALSSPSSQARLQGPPDATDRPKFI
ncbi:hypothetical protein IWQ60_001651 [Tieghemiomyces parasiticus]|uniref:Uncharacterized protein n=1 Tax=Tieghemiomyces parasiticus TaxID=78921 RepID=A0A9W8AGC7_9FUNG|nr:hypothetical protein IWQ60_001651 [Tieghemiomyces parasiticus]